MLRLKEKWIKYIWISCTIRKFEIKLKTGILSNSLTSSIICLSLSWIPCATLYFSLWLVFLLFLNCLDKFDMLSWKLHRIIFLSSLNMKWQLVVVNPLYKGYNYLPFHFGTFWLFPYLAVFFQEQIVHLKNFGIMYNIWSRLKCSMNMFITRDVRYIYSYILYLLLYI